MKKKLLIILLIYSVNSFGQSKIGITGGISLPWLYFKGDNPMSTKETRYDMVTSFHAGIISEFKLSDRIDFQPAIQFTGKGGRTSDFGIVNEPATREIRLYYIEMPLVFNYNFPVGKSDFFAGAGPNLAVGISGKDKQSSASFNNKYDAFETLFKRFDAGLKTQVGFRAKDFQLTASYSLGLVNIYEERPFAPPDEKITWKNHGLGFSVAYLFGLKR